MWGGLSRPFPRPSTHLWAFLGLCPRKFGPCFGDAMGNFWGLCPRNLPNTWGAGVFCERKHGMTTTFDNVSMLTTLSPQVCGFKPAIRPMAASKVAMSAPHDCGFTPANRTMAASKLAKLAPHDCVFTPANRPMPAPPFGSPCGFAKAKM